MLTLVTGVAVAQRFFDVRIGLDGVTRVQPLGTPPEVVTGLGTFAFSLTQPGDSDRPVTYDPCRPVLIEINDSLAPPGADALVRQGLDEVAAATGLVFEVVGRTDRLPQRRGYGLPRREPALLAWTTPEQLPQLEGDVAGIGGSTARPGRRSGDLEYVTGVVALDAPQLSTVALRPDGPARVRAIIVHELAHLVGLGHVEDTGELMYAESVGQLTLGPGDQEGLAALGRGKCSP